MPAYDVRAAYSILIAATPQRVWEELLNADFHSMPITRRLMRLRSLGRRKLTTGRPSTLATMGSGGAGGFLEISRVPEQEIVLAIAGRFWLRMRRCCATGKLKSSRRLRRMAPPRRHGISI